MDDLPIFDYFGISMPKSLNLESSITDEACNQPARFLRGSILRKTPDILFTT